MRREAWCTAISVAATLAVLAIGAIAVAYSGVPYVGADRPAPRIVDWFLSTASDRSVERHAGAIVAPPMGDEAAVRRGAAEYREMCAQCHGAPGVKPGELAEGLSPEPPKLRDSAQEMGGAELFWFAKHGVRMTGMPAWGKVHPDRILWDVVTFVRRLPEMTPAQYRDLSSGPAEGHGGSP